MGTGSHAGALDAKVALQVGSAQALAPWGAAAATAPAPPRMAGHADARAGAMARRRDAAVAGRAAPDRPREPEGRSRLADPARGRARGAHVDGRRAAGPVGDPGPGRLRTRTTAGRAVQLHDRRRPGPRPASGRAAAGCRAADRPAAERQVDGGRSAGGGRMRRPPALQGRPRQSRRQAGDERPHGLGAGRLVDRRRTADRARCRAGRAGPPRWTATSWRA